MAAGTVGFSVFNALLLRPPAVLRPDRLLSVYSSTPTEEFSGICYEDYTFYRDHNEVLSGLMSFPYSISMDPIVYEHRTKAGLTNAVSDTYFSVLGRCTYDGMYDRAHGVFRRTPVASHRSDGRRSPRLICARERIAKGFADASRTARSRVTPHPRRRSGAHV